MTAFASPFLAAFGGGTGTPVATPAVWVLAAAARRQLGGEDAAETFARTVAQTSTSQSLAAAAVGNQPPIIDEVTPTTVVDQNTGELEGQVIAHDPEGKKLKFTVTEVTGDGIVYYNTKTGTYTYAPSQEERVYVGTPAGAGYTVSFDFTISDGLKANNVVQTVDIDVPPIDVHQIAETSTGNGPFDVAATNDRAYVTNVSDGTITVIDTHTGLQVGSPIDVGSLPFGLALSPDGTKLYVVSTSGDPAGPSAVSVINTVFGNLIGAPINVGLGGFGIAVSPNGKTVYVTNVADATVSKINTANSKVTVSKVAAGPAAITVSPDGKKVYLTHIDPTTGVATVRVYSSSVSGGKLIDTSAPDSLPGGFSGVAVSPDNTAVAISHVDGSVTVYETKKNTQIASFDVDGGAAGLVFNNDGTILAVATNAGTVSLHSVFYGYDPLITVETNPDYALTFLPPQVALSPDGHQLFVTDDNTNVLHSITLVPIDVGSRMAIRANAIGPLAANSSPTYTTKVGNPSASTGAVKGSVIGKDADKDPLTYAGSTTTVKGGVVVVDATGKFVYTPSAAARHAAAAVGATADKSDTFDVTIDDGHGTLVTAAITVKISPLNAKPSKAAVALGAPNGSGAVVGNITATDADGDDFTLTGPASTKKGTVTYDNATDSFVFTPSAAAQAAAAAPKASAAVKTDSFKVTFTDGHGGTQTVTVKVNIAPASSTQNPVGTPGLPFLNAVVGSTGRVFQVITTGSSGGDFVSFVRVFSATGAVIGDTAPIHGTPFDEPVVRSDSGVAYVTYDQVTKLSTVTVVGATAGTTTTTFQGDPRGISPKLPGTDDAKYLVTAYLDAQNAGHILVVPLSAGAVTSYEVQGQPTIGADGSLYALQVSGTTPATVQVKVLRIKPSGSVQFLTAPEFLSSSLIGTGAGPNGTFYVSTVKPDQSSEVLVFDPSSTTATKIQVPGYVTGDVLVAPNGTVYQLSKSGVFADDVIFTRLTGGVVSSQAVPTGFFGADVVGVSNNGTVYLTAPDSDTDTTQLIIGLPNGTTSVVPLGDFDFSPDVRIGTDNNAYWQGPDGLTVITAAGIKVVPSLGGDVQALAFGADGRTYITVNSGTGVVVLSSINGFASFSTSSTVAGQNDFFGVTLLQAGPNGIAYVHTNNPDTILTAIGSNGATIGTVTGGGKIIGPVVFGADGTGYVTVQTGDEFADGPFKTAVWAVSASGATKIAEVDGQAATTGTNADAILPALEIGPDGKVYLTTVIINPSTHQGTTYVHMLSPTSVL